MGYMDTHALRSFISCKRDDHLQKFIVSHLKKFTWPANGTRLQKKGRVEYVNVSVWLKGAALFHAVRGDESYKEKSLQRRVFRGEQDDRANRYLPMPNLPFAVGSPELIRCFSSELSLIRRFVLRTERKKFLPLPSHDALYVFSFGFFSLRSRRVAYILFFAMFCRVFLFHRTARSGQWSASRGV
jgi:hypothetical protein